MTRVPLGASFRNGPGSPFSEQITQRYGVDDFDQGVGAEMMADKWGLSRVQLDEFSLLSHSRAAAAIDSGSLEGQCIPMSTCSLVDEGVRRKSTLETLAALPPVFKADGKITAGNSSQISDGSAALLITTSEFAKYRGWRPMVRLHSFAVVGDDPVMMLGAPIPATAQVLKKAGIGLEDVGAYEVNEAFASVPLAWLYETGGNPEFCNPQGGAIAVGHPLGASGAVLMTRLSHYMHQNGIRFGLQTMCEGGGMANATILELLNEAA
jgi:acetyl-CoA acyltransferase